MNVFRADNLSVERGSGIAHLRIDVSGRSHNVFSRQVLADLDAALDAVAGQPSLELLVLFSGKTSGFMAGADLHEFAGVGSANEATALSEAGQRLFDKLAGLPVPTVAVVHGPCLGGGLEVALACDYRLVLDQPGTQLGLPEIELGLVPGWGGTQRLPRVVGLEPALRVILQRHRLNAKEALQWGLADAVAADQQDALAFVTQQIAGRARREGKRPKMGLPLRTWRQRLLESTALGRGLVFRAAEKVLGRRVPDDMPAPLEALRAVQVGLTRGMEAGLKYEREAIGRLATTPACRNLITLFFLMEQARKGRGLEGEARATTPVRRVGVVGAGTMGAGIAQLAALKGFEVVVQEVNETALAAGMQKVEGLFQKAVERRLLSADEARRKFAAVGRTTAWEGFSEVDVVVEAAVEELDKKRAIFRELDWRTRPDAVLATNTSSLSVEQLQEGLTHPSRVAGLHFFNPVHKMPLVEVVRAPDTADAAVATLSQWAGGLGKTPVVVRDSPGFVVNRVLMPYLNEAVLLLAEGRGAEEIDRVMRRFGMPVGPLELLDQVGLDIAAHIARTMQPAVGDRFAPNPVFERMAREGWLGQKNGVGFYRYRGKHKSPNAAVKALLADGKPAADRGNDDVRVRLVLSMVNEAAACLAEGVPATAETVDLAMVLGTGWAPHRGGPLRYADDRGLGEVVQALEDLTRRIGLRFEPCAELRRRAAAGEPFYGQVVMPQTAS
jgi:3-hydroxyacyl-CoA dehydrogenase/enoyl-CoA hydratase/3-hydroxybutyryl-CoA epimerase